MQQINEVIETRAEQRILDASRTLARAIGQSEQFQRYEKMTERMMADQEARRLLSEFQEAQQTVQMAQGWGGASDEDFKRVEQLREQLFSHPTFKDYFQAQDDLVSMLKELNVFISEKLGFDFAGLTKPAGGCC